MILSAGILGEVAFAFCWQTCCDAVGLPLPCCCEYRFQHPGLPTGALVSGVPEMDRPLATRQGSRPHVHLHNHTTKMKEPVSSFANVFMYRQWLSRR